MNQRTIQSAVTLEGKGLHTGHHTKVTFKPAPENHGFKFQRVDLEGAPIVPAEVDYVVSTTRSTTLKKGEAQISTVEHALAALTGLQLDNILIEIDGPELPILDGSAKLFIDALLEAGIEEQKAPRVYFTIEEPITLRDEASGKEMLAVPAEQYEVTTLIDFDSPVLGMQYAHLERLEDFQEEISACRTFVFLHEIEQLLEHNLIQGGDLDNAVVIANRSLSQEEVTQLAQKLNRPDIQVAERGILNTSALHFANEPARHKLLDVVGDLALVGCYIKGKIITKKPGHTLNVEFAKKLRAAYKQQRKMAEIPKYDPRQEAIYDVNDIVNVLPHRFPFLLVDKITELSSTHVVGVKNVTINEQFFQGHFPGNPVMPGVLQIEAMAQTGGFLVLSTVEDPQNWDTYFLKIDNARFKKKVVPGDTVIFKLELKAPIRRGLCQMRGTAYVGDQIVSEGDLLAQIIRREDAQ